MKMKKRLSGILLTLALALGLMAGMSLTAYATTATYTNLMPTSSDTDLTSKQVTFNGYKWYIIADNSTAVNAGTVTLLAAESFGTSKFHNSSNRYSTSTIKTYLDDMTTASDGAFVGVASAINTVSVQGSDSDTAVESKLWLLSVGEANNVPENVRKFSANWWLRSPGIRGNIAAFVAGGSGYVIDYDFDVYNVYGVRPALKLNLSAVIFSSESKTFSLKPTEYEVTYKVVNGTWSDGSTTDRKETVQSGSKPASVPTGMKASQGYTGGAWDTNPVNTTITGAKTFTYTFTAKQTESPQSQTEAPQTQTEASAPAAQAERIIIPKAPAKVKAKTKKNSLTVSWNKIKKNKKTKALRAMIKNVEVQYSTDPAFPKETTDSRIIGKNKTKYVLRGLQRKTMYYIRVRYVDADGVSGWSRVKRARTK